MRKDYKLSLSKIVQINIIVDLLILLFGQVLCDYSNVFHFLLLLPDVVNIVTFMLLITKGGKLHVKNYTCIKILLIFTIYAFLSFIWTSGELIDGFQRFRYILTGFWIFFCGINYIDYNFLKKICSILYISLWIHTILIIYQVFVLNTGIDASNGIFGFIEYNNGAQGIYCLAIAILGVVCYLFNTAPMYKCVIMVILPCITCALSEIKAFYIEFIISVFFIMVYSMTNRNRIKKILFILTLLIVGGSIAYKILEQIMPENLYAFKSISSFIFYESYETTRAGGYGRYSQLQYVFKNIFNFKLLNSIFGMGVAYKKDIIVYEASKTLSNFGIFGLLFLLAFYILNIFYLWKKKEKNAFIALSIGFSVAELLSLFMWNATLNRMSYLGFLIVSLGYIANDNEYILKKCRYMIKR